MDKYDIVLDLIEQPAKYTPERIAEILNDPETGEIYNLLCKTDSTFVSNDAEVNVDEEWQTFVRIHNKSKFRFLRSGNRAASVAVIAFTSLAVVAIGITVAVKTFEPKQQPIEVATGLSVESAVNKAQQLSSDSTEVMEVALISESPRIFEDTALEDILSYVAEVHGAIVEYEKPETAQLHLYYKFDPSISLKETVDQLNTFEQINIRINGKKIIVD